VNVKIINHMHIMNIDRIKHKRSLYDAA
jgi:hypothetical protein